MAAKKVNVSSEPSARERNNQLVANERFLLAMLWMISEKNRHSLEILT
jgi:hypothetical protein